MIKLKLWGERNKLFDTAKKKYSMSLKKTEDSDRQFLVEKIIHSIEFSNP